MPETVGGLNSAHSLVPGVIPLMPTLLNRGPDLVEFPVLETRLGGCGSLGFNATSSDRLSSGLAVGVGDDDCRELRLRLDESLSDSIRSKVMRKSFSACFRCKENCSELTEFALEALLDVGADIEGRRTGGGRSLTGVRSVESDNALLRRGVGVETGGITGRLFPDPAEIERECLLLLLAEVWKESPFSGIIATVMISVFGQGLGEFKLSERFEISEPVLQRF